MNHMIHIAAATQIRLDTDGRAYYRRKLAAGKSRREAMRCLKRRISDALYRQLRRDAAAEGEAGPGDAYVIEPGHDAWVVGDETFVGYEFESKSAEEYAKGP